jgi:hypothetical protein
MIERKYVAVVSKVITHRLYREFVPVLEDYLHFSRRESTSAIRYHKLQQWLLLDVLEYQGGTCHHRERKKEFSEMIRGERNEEKKRGLISELQESGIQQVMYKIMLRNVRDIVDGMAWRLFDFNRAKLTILGSSKSNLSIQLSRGLELELAELVKYCYYGRIALLNDLTSVIDVGDVTVRNADGTFEFHEIKASGRRTPRTERQARKQARAVEFINRGSYEEDGQSYRLVNLDIAHETHLPKVYNVIKEAKAKGYCGNVVSKYLIVECAYVDMFSSGDALEDCQRKGANIRKCWDPADKLLILSNLHRLRLRLRLFPPYSIFPYPEDICVDLMSGRALLFALVNYSAVLRILRRAGWVVREAIESESFMGGPPSVQVLELKRGAFKTSMTGGDLLALGLEFVKMDTLLRRLEASYDLSSRRKKNEIWCTNISSEKTVWR